jgi:hypothetical protein
MNDHLAAIRSVVTELEAIQENIGKSQVELLQVLTDDTQDDWDCPSQIALVKLEDVQKTIGEVQTLLVEAMPVCHLATVAIDSNLANDNGDSRVPSASSISDPSVATAVAASSDTAHTATISSAAAVATSPKAATVSTPQQLLEARGVKVTRTAPASGLDATADRAALILGEKFSLLESFYRAVRARLTNKPNFRWFRTSELSREAVTAICDFGTKMMAGGFFSEFRYFSKGTNADHPEAVVLFNPTADARIRGFFEGGWLERYALQVIKREAQKTTGVWCDEQFAKGVHVEFSDGTKGELDSLVSTPPDKLLWLECKSGKWQNYIKRFQSINRKFLRIPKGQSALVLVHELDDAEKASASELTGMTVIHFSELREWLKKAIG